jgi:hypothetical protein
MSKKYTTNFLEDTNGSTGSANQVLVSTAAGIDWVDGSGSGIIGGPYLPLSAGSSYPLTGDLAMNNNIGIITKDSSGAFRDILKLNSTNVLEIGSSALNTDTIFKNTGNVGIGVTGPSNTLHVFKNSTIGPITSPTVANAGLRIQDNGASLYVDGNSLATDSAGYLTTINNNHFDIGTNSTSRIHITSGGNVGIGTTSPNRSLHVIGQFAIDNSTSPSGGLLVIPDGTSNKVYSRTGNATNSPHPLDFISGSSTSMRIAASGNVGIGTTSPTSNKLVVAGGVDVWNSTNTLLRLGHNGTRGDIQAFTSGAYGILAINSGGGNVGIGTTSPAYPLDIVGFANSSSGFRVTDGTIDNRVSWSSGNVGFFGTVSNHPIAFNTNLTERMRITSSGNVGIGTTSPSAKLEILKSGTNEFPTLGTASGNVYLTDGGLWGMFMGVDSTSGTGWIQQMRNDSAVAYDISLNPVGGNVGIGTTSPDSKLHVQGTSFFFDQAIFDDKVGIGTTNPGAKLDVVGTTSPQAKIGYDANNYVQVSVNGVGDTSIAPTGNGIIPADLTLSAGSAYVKLDAQTNNVGIGTTSPSEKLEVDGNVQAETLIATDLNDGYVPYNRNGTLGLQDSSIYQNNGNVGIGTTTPSEKLDVNGTIKATDYKGWIPTFQHGGFNHGSSLNNLAVYWIPTTAFSETTTSMYYNNWIAPYAGRVKKIIMRWTGNGSAPTATSVTFKYAVNATTDSASFPATVVNGATIDMTVTKAFGDNDMTWDEGDRVQIGFRTDGGTRLLRGFAYTVEIEYNKN